MNELNIPGGHIMISIPINQKLVTDEDVFAAFDLNRPELSNVHTALCNNNLPLAKKELVHYFEGRAQVSYHFDYRSLPLKKIDTDSNPYIFQASLGLSGSLKEFCLDSGKKMMEHIYVRPGREHTEIDLGINYENLPHFDFYNDMGKKTRAILDIFVRGQFYEYLFVLYHETGDKKVLHQFEEFLQIFLDTYPLIPEYTAPDASRFSFSDERDVMSVGWLILEYTSLLYTRVPYEIDPDLAFEIIKNIWFLGMQFRRFDTDTYRKFNHHMWERGLVPFILGTLFPEIPDFLFMKERGASIICEHIKDEFNEQGGYSEHSIPYWSGAALGEMLYRGIHLARINGACLLDEDSKKRINLTFNTLALISPPHTHYPSLGDNGGPLVDPILHIGVEAINNNYCKEVLAIRHDAPPSASLPLFYCSDKGGFVCGRSSFLKDANYFLMSAKTNCGESGHNHMDMLSLFVVFRGEEFIGEPHARQLYHRCIMGSDHRGYQYNMGSHNTVLAYGKPVQPNEMYADKWGVYRPDSPVSFFSSDSLGLIASAYHDAYTTCRHERTVWFHHKHGLLVKDDMERGNRMPTPHIQRWNLLPDVKCKQLDDRSILLEKNGVRVLCLWTDNPTLFLWKKEDLCPNIVNAPSELSTILDVSFYTSPTEKSDVPTVSQSVLMLDATEYLPPVSEYDHLISAMTEIAKDKDGHSALLKFEEMRKDKTL